MASREMHAVALVTTVLLFAGCSQTGPLDGPTGPTSLGTQLGTEAVGPLSASTGAPVIREVPADDPGPPFYTPVFIGGATPPAGFVPTDGDWVGIHWYRDPSCVPGGFNLLQVFDPPAAFGCGLTLTGKVWRHEATDQVPFQEHYAGAGAVPIYFVQRAELMNATGDGVLTIAELQSLPSLLVGHASSYRGVIHNSNQASNHGHETLTAHGHLADGRSFSFHFNEKFVGGQHTFQSIRIEFR